MRHWTAKVIDPDPEPAIPKIVTSGENSGARFVIVVLNSVSLGFIEARVTDKRMLRLLRKWLRVGWVEDGKRHPGTIGTPQGSVISPFLSNIFLSTVMDEWANDWRRTQAKGDVIMVRYVDDAVFGFQYESEGRMFLNVLRARLAAYELTLHPTKTRLVEFGRFAASNRRRRRVGKPETFDF